MARTDQQITTEALRELTYQSPGFWSRMFRRAISSMMPDFTPRQAPLFDRIVGRIGSSNNRQLREHARSEELGLNFNQKAADHLLRTMLQGAEALGASAEELASINWESLDIRDLFTNNADEWFDLTRIPGMSQNMQRIFGQVGRNIDTAFMQQIGRTFPERLNERIQSGRDTIENERARDRELDTLFERLNKGLQWVSPDPIDRSRPANQPQGEAFFDKLARMFGGDIQKGLENAAYRDVVIDDDGDTVLNPNIATDKINNYIEQVFGQQQAGRSVSLVRSILSRAAPIASRAGNAIFGALPQFIQRPILLAAGRGGAMAAQAAGQGVAGQTSAAAAAMGAARLATAFKALQLGTLAIVGAIKMGVEAITAVVKHGRQTVDSVASYSGALSFAQANFERNEMLRNIRMARDIEGIGEELINAKDRLAEAMHPADEAAAKMGARGGAMWDNLQAGGLEVFNSGAEVMGEIPLIGGAIESMTLTLTKYMNEWVPQAFAMVGIMKNIAIKVGLIEENTKQDGNNGRVVPINALGAPGDPMRDWFDAVLPGGRRVPPVQRPQGVGGVLPGVNAIANALNALNK